MVLGPRLAEALSGAGGRGPTNMHGVLHVGGDPRGVEAKGPVDAVEEYQRVDRDVLAGEALRDRDRRRRAPAVPLSLIHI